MAILIEENKPKFFLIEAHVKKAQINNDEFYGDEKVRQISKSYWEDLREHHSKDLKMWSKVIDIVFKRMGRIRVPDISSEFKRITGDVQLIERKNDWGCQDLRSFLSKVDFLMPKQNPKIRIDESMRRDMSIAMNELLCGVNGEENVKWYSDRFEW